MSKGQLYLLCSILLFCGCSTMPLQQASDSYKKNRDYESLKVINSRLFKGMKRTSVEQLLGAADYSPTEGQYYYSSDHEEYLDEENKNHKATVGIVVDYRNEEGAVTEKLHSFWLGPIGE